MLKSIRISSVLALLSLGIIAVSTFQFAQTTGPVARYTATTANISGAGDSVRIDLLSWSTDADRDKFVGAWNLTTLPAAPGAGGPGGGGRGGRGGGRGDAPAPEAGAAAGNPAGAPPAAGGGRGGRGGGAPPAGGGAPDAGAAAGNAAAGAAGGGRGGRGGGGGGRGGAGGGAPAADAPKPTPERALATALQGANTIGYIWTSESAGYSLKYAYKVAQPDGSERIILATDRRLGGWNDLWKPAGNATVNDYDFSLVEIRLNAKGLGEGKTSLTGKVVVDSTAKTVALDGYAGLPIVFKDVKRTAGK